MNKIFIFIGLALVLCGCPGNGNVPMDEPPVCDMSREVLCGDVCVHCESCTLTCNPRGMPDCTQGIVTTESGAQDYTYYYVDGCDFSQLNTVHWPDGGLRDNDGGY